MNKNNLKEELQLYYEEGDCCSWIVKLRKSNVEKDKEIERLNNIINELEKYIKTNAPREIRGNIIGDYEVYIDGQFLFNKLQELKEKE